jgi:hypothetical protein
MDAATLPVGARVEKWEGHRLKPVLQVRGEKLAKRGTPSPLFL